jgi:hypothetical protein
MPWDGIAEVLKDRNYIMVTLILIALLNPDAKNPPKGAIRLTNKLMTIACIWNSEKLIDYPIQLYNTDLVTKWQLVELLNEHWRFDASEWFEWDEC